ncbi:uncharacterized protein LOC101892721 [Musca domestica]|uniref:Uncharacterized protein LOC101892721 isoform X2 n=1 Tax=Musca domestica TaxID=7370 RepID=A0A1I8MC25_MUSDO|nr:uncharacterized protein LOC101892721 [Musca domestica]
MLRATVVWILLYSWLVTTGCGASKSNANLEIDENVTPLYNATANKQTPVNRVVNQVKKIVNDLRNKTETTFKQWTRPKKPITLTNTKKTNKPLAQEHVTSNKTHVVKSKPTKRPRYHYYGALNRRFYEDTIQPPEIIEN